MLLVVGHLRKNKFKKEYLIIYLRIRLHEISTEICHLNCDKTPLGRGAPLPWYRDCATF